MTSLLDRIDQIQPTPLAFILIGVALVVLFIAWACFKRDAHNEYLNNERNL
jgi:hypothetical protein